MKIMFSLAICLFLVADNFAQSQEADGKIALSVVMPENVDGLDASQLSKLESKILQITSSAGLTGVGYGTNFVIYPKFALYDESVAEAGMQNITVITADLSIFIKQVDRNIVFSTFSKTLKGSGKNKYAAVTNAIANISFNDPTFQKFIQDGKAKIIQYYESSCEDIQLKASTLSKMQEYDHALSLLLSVPEEVSCYTKVLNQSVDIFKAYQAQHCKELIQYARASLEVNDYTTSLATLSQIDPSSPCAEESLQLLKTNGTKVDAQEKRDWDFAMRVYSDEVALEKMRISAIRDIAVAYAKSQPSTINYTTIIK